MTITEFLLERIAVTSIDALHLRPVLPEFGMDGSI